MFNQIFLECNMYCFVLDFWISLQHILEAWINLCAHFGWQVDRCSRVHVQLNMDFCLFLFIFNYHIVQDNTQCHYVHDVLSLPHACRTSYNIKSRLQDVEYTLHNLPCTFWWAVKRQVFVISRTWYYFHEHSPFTIYSISKVISCVVLICVHNKLDSWSFPSQLLDEQWWLIVIAIIWLDQKVGREQDGLKG
jgi:hypothetical protein